MRMPTWESWSSWRAWPRAPRDEATREERVRQSELVISYVLRGGVVLSAATIALVIYAGVALWRLIV